MAANDVCVPFNFAKSGKMAESENWSPQQPLQEHTGHGLTQARFITYLLKSQANTLRVRLQPWHVCGPAAFFVNLSLICFRSAKMLNQEPSKWTRVVGSCGYMAPGQHDEEEDVESEHDNFETRMNH
nr:hypothetical protein [Tanacetum cinerariifolium]